MYLATDRELCSYEGYVHHVNRDDVELGMHPRLSLIFYHQLLVIRSKTDSRIIIISGYKF